MLKKLIPFEAKAEYWLWYFKIFAPIKDISVDNDINPNKKNRIFIFLAADYGNLGDIAITYAQHKFLKKQYPNYQITEIPISTTIEGIARIKKNITTNDLITIVGGGNFGDLYPKIEHYRQMVIKNFPNNKIICFPQTIDFLSKEKLSKTSKIYARHKQLTIIARELVSYETLQKHFNRNQLGLTPDIVLSLNLKPLNLKRRGVILCLRNDREKKLTPSEEKSLLALLNNTFETSRVRDTHINKDRLSLRERTRELHEIWKDFQSSELIVTDRLHGMIFAHITNTPAMVFLNNNHKIKTSYHWISQNSKIQLMESYSEVQVKKAIRELRFKTHTDSRIDLKNEYGHLKHLG